MILQLSKNLYFLQTQKKKTKVEAVFDISEKLL